MMRAIAIKELRETVGIAAIALVLFAAVFGAAVGMQLIPRPDTEVRLDIPFVGGGFLSRFGSVTYGLAIALAMRQTAWEGMRGTYLLLLHYPRPRSSIFAVKLLIGLALLQLTAALPLLAYAFWAATPGTHASPFEWSMTADAWRTWWCLPIVYLGAFLSGLRPARWVGTRLLPLVAAILVFMILSNQIWWISLLGMIVVSAILIVVIRHVAVERDYG